ncbi:MAG: hypothetical protein ACYDHT_10030 [Solirubrobacteraceae bacterium]
MISPPAEQTAAEGPGKPGRLDRLADTVFRGRVLLSSYAALDLILVARLHHWSPWRWAFLGLALTGILDALRLTILASRTGAVRRTFTAVSDSGGEIAGYLATYLLPLLAAPDPSTGDIAGYAIYAVLIAVVTLRSDLAHVNPTLYLLGWKIVTVTTRAGNQKYLVCRRTPRPGEPVRVTDMNGLLHSAGHDGA